MYYSYVMGINNSIMELKDQGFDIQNDGGNFMVSFPKEKSEVWEKFITGHLEFEYWNEYLAEEKIVFLFHLPEGIKRYEVHNFENPEVLALCEKLCECKFESIRAMLRGNHFYKDKLMTNEDLYAPIREKYQALKGDLEGNDLQQIIARTLEVHAMVHPRSVSGLAEKTISDYVFDYMQKENNKEAMVPRMDCPIDLDWAGTDVVPMCWHFWHTYRIEDLVSNILIGSKEQIFNDEWQRKINSPILDTGNALERDEVIAFAKNINFDALKEYMIAVGKNTREIIANLTIDKLKQKASKEQLDRIINVGGLTLDKRSIWLIDYWGGLDVAGMILTPLTDHHMMHLPPCLGHLPIVEVKND